MPVSEEAVYEKLKNVIDPELFVNVVDLGLIYGVKLGDAGPAPTTGGAAELTPGGAPGAKTVDAPVEASVVAHGAKPADADVPACSNSGGTASPGQTNVFIEMTMTSPACPAGPQLISGAKREVAAIAGVGNVEVKIVLDPPWTPDRMTEDAKDQLGIF